MLTSAILEHLVRSSGPIIHKSGARVRRFSSSGDKFRKFNEGTVERLPFGQNYFEWVEADYLDAPLDIHTKTAAESPLLSRNNVGMGFLVLNSKYSGISQINGLYRRLADLETNVYKRFVLVTSMTRKTFSLGLNPSEIFMFLGSMQKLLAKNTTTLYEPVVNALRNYLYNLADLSYLIFSYKKPLLVYANGSTAGYGMCLASLSNMSACYHHSKFRYSGYNFGMPPLGGLSYVLGRLDGCIGEYLALTGEEISGTDLIYSGLIERFISPDAIKVLQITSDRLMDLPERETYLHLREHFLPVKNSYSLHRYEPLIMEHFSKSSIEEIKESLSAGADKSITKSCNLAEGQVKDWENKTLESIKKNTDKYANVSLSIFVFIFLQGTLKLIKRVKRNTSYLLEKYARHIHAPLDTPPDYGLDMRHALEKPLHDAIMEEVLTDAINEEIDAFCDITSKILGKNIHLKTSNKWQPFERSGFAISSVPGLKKLHPDYNPKTGCEYDKKMMERQVERWSDTFLQKELLMMKRIIETYSN
ncbi:conserved hypothetical protein [Theileria equi strain WA]|uniref:3-hydroxyisobutyryl-CoA hydrolase n=1 Tax=Theileria equi strain WA TaxID=1537102 RepID=L1LCB4_THEEQ|nr:conserved hypothetical protein [Theileria equi strain WA]EKX72986.1 conserved hypothetical protein [Theileria equi strain WA]|eukprot:XP_004832438.1 conserved hypothetical protein [Theileria equi strain WA]